MLVVIVLVGAGGYFAFNTKTSTTPTSTTGGNTVTTCNPPNSPVCKNVPTTFFHDVSLLIPFASAQTGNPVPATASVPSSDATPAYYVFNFGDGSAPVNTTSATANHAYSEPGTYIVSVNASIKGVMHDNAQDLGVVSISSSFASATAANSAGVSGAIARNTSSTTAPTAILQPGGYVLVQGSYTSAPTNPDYLEQSPTIMSSGGTMSDLTNTSTSASANVSFGTAGTYTVSFVGVSMSTTTGAMAYQNFTWTVYVAPTGVNAGVQGVASAQSPHSGKIVTYTLAPGGANSEDPAIDYETVGYEPILNVYQTLIAYNQSLTGPSYQAYVPVIAACVPGSVTGANNCMQMFGSSLLNGSDYTFVISGAPQFYDPATSAHWGVWPTDVEFSIARTLGFAVQPCFGCNNGWILGQALLNTGNPTWDGGIHGARNNTPQNVYASMTLNGSECPSMAMSAPYHGCITFHADGNGLNWPYFLELISFGLGGSVVPCGWFSASAQGAGIPYWTSGNSSGNGDHPCAAPGQNGYGLAANDPSLPATGWDTWETDGSGTLGTFLGSVQWDMVGSGPYYSGVNAGLYNPGTSYTLQANPYYAPNPLCTWQGCFPQPGSFASTVSVTWETTQITGEVAYQNGVADFASIPSTDTGLLLQLIQQGKVKTLSYPSLAIDFMPFNFAFDVAGAKRYTTNPITIPSDAFSYVGLRQFVSHAYPYDTIQQTINTKLGLQYAFNYGGAIPQFMANYYPTNVSWPSGNPDTNPADVGGAAWWWAQISQNTSSPYYDSELSGCTSSSPCQFPLFGQTGAPDLDQRINLWAAEINSLSGGALRANPVDINFVDAVINSLYTGPYQNPMPLFRLGWAPDYPDPTDYMVPLYYADSSYTYSDSVWEQIGSAGNPFNSSGCHSWQDWTYWSHLAQTSGIPTDCQGAAYSAMIYGMNLAAVMPAGPARVLAYNEVEQIGNGLALYVYTFQNSYVASFAPWINGASLNTNVTIGGGADETWYMIQGTGVAGSS